MEPPFKGRLCPRAACAGHRRIRKDRKKWSWISAVVYNALPEEVTGNVAMFAGAKSNHVCDGQTVQSAMQPEKRARSAATGSGSELSSDKDQVLGSGWKKKARH